MTVAEEVEATLPETKRAEYRKLVKKGVRPAIAASIVKGKRETYTIDVPGFHDIFILPGGPYSYPTWREAKAMGWTKEQWHQAVPEWVRKYRQQRAIRMKTARSPIPENLRWIPQVIQHIDDAQDLLYTALVLAKPLIRRLPSRFIPYVGWILLLNDLLNLATFLLSLPMSGGSLKAVARSIIGNSRAIRRGKAKAVQRFLKGRTPWLPFVLQAGQALESITGYGIRLGGVMGMYSDAAWGLVRRAQGHKVVFRKPPDETLKDKAVAIAIRAPTAVWYQGTLTKWEEAIIIAANAIAFQILDEEFEPEKIDQRSDDLAGVKDILFEIEDEDTIEELQAAGLPTNVEDMKMYHPLPTGAYYVDITREAVGHEMEWQKVMKERYDACEAGMIMHILHEQPGEWLWDHYGGQRGNYEPIWDPELKAITKAVEYGVRPPEGADMLKVWEWLRKSQEMAEEVGRPFPTSAILMKAAKELLGGYVRV